MSRRAVFLDRDGVINAYVYNPEFGTVDSPARPDDFTLLPGAAEAIAKLKRAGLLTIVVSNQPGVAKGRFTPELLHTITGKMKRLVELAGGSVDAVYCCPHHPDGTANGYGRDCECRKPNPGLLARAAREHGLNLAASWVVGDRYADLEMAHTAGGRGILVMTGYGRGEYELHHARWPRQPDALAADLTEAVRRILND